jgi:hypothetical protein
MLSHNNRTDKKNTTAHPAVSKNVLLTILTIMTIMRGVTSAEFE